MSLFLFFRQLFPFLFRCHNRNILLTEANIQQCLNASKDRTHNSPKGRKDVTESPAKLCENPLLSNVLLDIFHFLFNLHSLF